MNTISDKKKREYFYREDTTQFGFRCNPDLTKLIKDISEERRRSFSSTIRMLVYLGAETYDNNALEGNSTSIKRRQAAALRRAEAAAAAAVREARKRGKIVTYVTPMLFGSDADE